jgi:hypothetical protein
MGRAQCCLQCLLSTRSVTAFSFGFAVPGGEVLDKAQKCEITGQVINGRAWIHSRNLQLQIPCVSLSRMRRLSEVYKLRGKHKQGSCGWEGSPLGWWL